MTKPLPTDRRIVVGVDGSPASVDALRWASSQAELIGGTLEMITSWQVPTQYGTSFYGDQFDWAELAQRTLETAIKEAGDGTPTAGIQSVVQGSAAHALVDASHDAELLVVGTRGHGGFAGLLLGSVSEFVIAHAHCPVLVVRHRPEDR